MELIDPWSCYLKYGEDGKLEGFLISHVDDMVYNGGAEFVAEVEALFRRELKLSKVEKGHFRFCGLDLMQKEGRIEISMEDYAGAIEETSIPKGAKNDQQLGEK